MVGTRKIPYSASGQKRQSATGAGHRFFALFATKKNRLRRKRMRSVRYLGIALGFNGCVGALCVALGATVTFMVLGNRWSKTFASPPLASKTLK
jgi:hypothetical protein